MTFADETRRAAAFAAQMLGWRPDEFWRATPADLRLAMAPAEPVDAPLSRASLERLMEEGR